MTATEPERPGLLRRLGREVEVELAARGAKVRRRTLVVTFLVATVGTALSSILLSFTPGSLPFTLGSITTWIALVGQLTYAAAGSARHLYDSSVDLSVDQRLLATHVYLADALRVDVERTAGLHLNTPDERQAIWRETRTSIVKSLVAAPLRGQQDRTAGLRCALYLLNDQQDELTVDFSDDDHAGSRNTPQPFSRGSERGNKALDWVLGSADPIYVPDIRKAPDEWAGSGADYNSFISVRIAGSKGPIGMLTLDTPEVDDLSEDLVPIMQLTAASLAVAYQMMRGRN